MKVFVIRSNEKGYGECYHGKDGVCQRSPINAVKYVTYEAANKAVNAEIIVNPHEIIPMTIEYTLHEDEKTLIEPEIDE